MNEVNPTDPRTVLGTREHAEAITEGRHPGVRDALQWLTYAHLPSALRRFSAPFYAAAVDLVTEISVDSPELTTALNRLIEAKDSGVRAGIKADTGRAGSVPRPQSVVNPPALIGSPQGVHYTLSEQDAEAINRRRADFADRPEGPGHEGFQAHVGNRAEAGQVFPSTVVRTFGGDAVNLQVHLDGSDTYWATSRTAGDGPGQWFWPPRV